MAQRCESSQSYEDETRRHYQHDDVAREYHEQFAAKVSLGNLSHVLVAKAEQRSVRRVLESIRSDLSLVADVPCGSGKLMPVLAGLSLSAIAGDVSSPMLQIARAVADRTSTVAKFVRLDITALPFPDGAFDAVICLRFLHRVPSPIKSAALLELRRIARRYVVVSYGIQSAWHRLRQRLRGLLVPGKTVPYPETRASLDSLFERVGLSVVRQLRPLPVLSAEEIAVLVK